MMECLSRVVSWRYPLRMPGQERIRVTFAGKTTPWFDDLSVSPRELKSLVNGSGWQVERLLETAGSPYYTALLQKARCR